MDLKTQPAFSMAWPSSRKMSKSLNVIAQVCSVESAAHPCLPELSRSSKYAHVSCGRFTSPLGRPQRTSFLAIPQSACFPGALGFYIARGRNMNIVRKAKITMS